MTSEQKNTLLLIRNVIKSIDPTSEVILFGSRARGDFWEESDWDILILIEKEKVLLEDERIFRHALYQLELEISQPISIFVYPKQEWNGRLSVTPLFESVQTEGIML